MKKLVELVVAAAHRRGHKVGICGQAPSDHTGVAEYLEIGIESISFDADARATAARRLAGVER